MKFNSNITQVDTGVYEVAFQNYVVAKAIFTKKVILFVENPQGGIIQPNKIDHITYEEVIDTCLRALRSAEVVADDGTFTGVNAFGDFVAKNANTRYLIRSGIKYPEKSELIIYGPDNIPPR